MWSVMKETFIERLLDRVVVGASKERGKGSRKRMLSVIECSKVLFLVPLYDFAIVLNTK